jgi:hypothetical protein
MSRPKRNYLNRICEYCKKQYSKNYKESQKQWEKRRFCSRSCGNKALKQWNTLIPYQFKNGHKVPEKWKIIVSNNLWKGGSKRNKKILDSGKYKNWRKKVFERDNYTCQICGYKGNKLVAHHIMSWSKFIKLRFVVNNGSTLCENCHKNNICICPKYRKNYGLEHHFIFLKEEKK